MHFVQEQQQQKTFNYLKWALTTSGAANFYLLAMQHYVSDRVSSKHSYKGHETLFGNIPLHSKALCNARLMQLTPGFRVSNREWAGGAKVLCILHHWGVQLILAYSWARPAILVVGKGKGGMFLFLLFLHFHSCSSFFPVPLFHLLYSLFYLFSPFLWETTQNDPQGLTCR